MDRNKPMDAREIAGIARNFSVMVRIQGPDPKGLKMRGHAFHLHESGTTTLSASGLLLPPGSLRETPSIIERVCSACSHSGAVALTIASVVEPFLIAEQRNNPGQLFSPKLIPSVRVEILVEGGKTGVDGEVVARPNWIPCEVLTLVDVSAASAPLGPLIGDHNDLLQNASWEFGWSMARLIDSSHAHASQRILLSGDSRDCFPMAQSVMRIAFLGVSSFDVKDMLHMDVSQPQKRGDLLLVMGSPFGILSPFHFLNSVSVGAVANCCSQDPYHWSLLMADIQCLPGMEGGPVFDKNARLAGILMIPLRQKSGGAEIQLVLTWDAIATACREVFQENTKIPGGKLRDRDASSVQTNSLYNDHHIGMSLSKRLESSTNSELSVERALPSIVLATVGDGAWASGILLNDRGLVLTNAHLLEPWRFRKTSLLGLTNEPTKLSAAHKRNPLKEEGNYGGNESHILLTSQMENSNMDIESAASLLNRSVKNYKISVRLEHMKHQIWCDASAIYISKGPFDVALLQMDSVPPQLKAIKPEFTHLSKGINVNVIGHGLLGPRSGLGPSVSSGVLANIVRIPGDLHLPSIGETIEQLVPVMLQTTAAVHPGASGGAVVNSNGHMIGLVTSNAKHAGGTTVPHLNFSIPCAALKPIFHFAEKQDMSILQVLDRPNELLSSVWALAPPPSSRAHSSLENNQEGRGSRFARFLSEKQPDLNPNPKDQQRLIIGKFPGDILHRSKM